VTDAHAPSFDADWQRRAFGVAVALSEFGHYPWNAFQQQPHHRHRPLGVHVRIGTRQLGYYEHWLTALEHTLVQHSLIEPEELAELPR
jgi:nitrile hydratase accessory protein